MPPIYTEDYALARRAARDDTVFSEIVNRYQRLIYNVALRSAGTPEDADDIAQDAFLKAWKSLSSFRGDCALSTWLCRIALSCACDHARAKKRRAAASLTVSDPENDTEHILDIPATDPADLPEEAALRQMEIAAVREAIDALPEEQRVLVVMRDLSDMSYAEIADALGLELGTVKSRLSRARGAIKEFLIARNFFSAPPSNTTEKGTVIPNPSESVLL